MRYKIVDISLFRFVTMHAFDKKTNGRTDGQTNSFIMAIPCVALHAVAR